MNKLRPGIVRQFNPGEKDGKKLHAIGETVSLNNNINVHYIGTNYMIYRQIFNCICELVLGWECHRANCSI